MAKSQWSFKTAVELSAALAAKKVQRGRTGAGRHRPHRAARRQDQRDLRARFRARPRRRPRRRRRTGARREEAAARHPHDGEGILQHRRPADDLGHSGAEGFHRRRKTRCRSPASRTPAASSSARPTCRSGSATGRATTRSTAPPTIRSISAARRAALPADRRRRWPPATARCRSAPTSAARCACRRFIAASMRTSRPSTWSPCAATRRRRCRRCRSTATLA